MKAHKQTTNPQQAGALKPAYVKRVVRKSARAATKAAAYTAYVREHEKAFKTLATIDTETLKSLRSGVEIVLAKRKLGR